nr:Dihydrofolate reductase [uncultured bacterium]
MISIFVAMTKNRVIGEKDQLPWRLSSDLKRFKELTTGHPVIMGRQTYESLPIKFRPLPNRTNIVLTRNKDFDAPECIVAHSLAQGIEEAKLHNGSDEIFIMGGGQIYEQALPLTDRIYLTEVETTAQKGDTFFPKLHKNDWYIKKAGGFEQDEKNQYAATFYIYDRKETND